MDDYNEYARVFNTGNDALLLDKFFSFPFTFSTPFMNQTYKTRDEFLEALNFVSICSYSPSMMKRCLSNLFR